MRRGLVFGKFMPLHHGHELLINRAMLECDDVTIVVYDSKVEGAESMPIQKRLEWVSLLYPGADCIVSVPDLFPQGEGDDPAHAQAYADQLSPFGPFDRVYTSEPSYEDFASLLGAQHVIVDDARTTVPISGTEIRSNLYENRSWMHPAVYSSLIQKVVFVGTESTGKSTLAEAMAKKYDTLWVHEYGRELWESQGLTGTFQDHVKMGQKQSLRELNAAKEANRYLFCDTNSWVTLQWSLFYYKTADHRLQRQVERTMKDYVWIMCDNDFDWVDDGVRELHGDLARGMHNQQWYDLQYRNVPFYEVWGSIFNRVEQVKEILSGERSPYNDR